MEKMNDYKRYLDSPLAQECIRLDPDPTAQNTLHNIQVIAMQDATPLLVEIPVCEQIMSSASYIEPSAREWKLTRDILPGESGFCWFETPIPICANDPASFLELTALTWLCSIPLSDDGVVAGDDPAEFIILCALIRTLGRMDGMPGFTVLWKMRASYAQTVRRHEFGSVPEKYALDTQVTQILRVFATLFHLRQANQLEVSKEKQ